MITYKVNEIELFKNLLECEIENEIIDLHNDYRCEQIEFTEENNRLSMLFCHYDNSRKFKYIFENVSFRQVNMNFESVENNITIDNFYRGRYEIEKELKDCDSNGRGYIYIEFYEGINFEFFAKNLIIEKINIEGKIYRIN